jgi:hypothetical protein
MLPSLPCMVSAVRLCCLQVWQPPQQLLAACRGRSAAPGLCGNGRARAHSTGKLGPVMDEMKLPFYLNFQSTMCFTLNPMVMVAGGAAPAVGKGSVAAAAAGAGGNVGAGGAAAAGSSIQGACAHGKEQGTRRLLLRFCVALLLAECCYCCARPTQVWLAAALVWNGPSSPDSSANPRTAAEERPPDPHAVLLVLHAWAGHAAADRHAGGVQARGARSSPHSLAWAAA